MKCRRCGSVLRDGKCSDETCPFSDCLQDDPNGWIGHPERFITSSVYVDLFHGRKTRDEEMEDWGVQGPVLGPYKHVTITYKGWIKCGKFDGDADFIKMVSDLVYYDGMFYGDFTMFGDLSGFESRLEEFDNDKAKVPETVEKKMG